MKSTSKTLPKRRPGRVQRRKDLLGVVYEVISEVGVSDASMRQIADRANVSTGTINYHFENKQKLIMAALQAAYETPSEESEASSPLQQLKVFAFSHVFRSSVDRYWRFWVNYAAAATRNNELRRHQNLRFEKQLRFWSRLVDEAKKSGELKSDTKAEVIAERLLIFVHGLVMRQILRSDTETREHSEEMLEDYFRDLEGTKRKSNGNGVHLRKRTKAESATNLNNQ